MRNFQTDRFLFLATEEASPTRLAQGHSRRLGFVPTFRYSSTFLRPFAPSPLRDFFATMDALTPASSALRSSTSNMNTVSVRRQVSLIHVSDLPIPPSPTTPQILDADFSRYPSSRRVSHCRGSRFHLWPSRLTDSDRPNRVSYRTDGSFTSCCSPPRLTTTQLQLVTGRRAYT